MRRSPSDLSTEERGTLERRGPLNVLCVGDGDLSCSLAIHRAYGNNEAGSTGPRIGTLIATTLLPSREELVGTYPNAGPVVDELEAADGCSVLYGVDATQLHRNRRLELSLPFDYVLFQHPHLGLYGGDIQSKEAAARHSSLLAHYLDSARQLLLRRAAPRSDCFVHVCLCGSEVFNWDLDGVVQRLGLEYALDSPRAGSRPLLEHLDDAASNANDPAPSGFGEPPQSRLAKCRGRNRRGHWLGRYGYRHQPTFPQKTAFRTNISNSYHFFFHPTTAPAYSKSKDGTRLNCCDICLEKFDNESALAAHELAPAIPVERPSSDT